MVNIKVTTIFTIKTTYKLRNVIDVNLRHNIRMFEYFFYYIGKLLISLTSPQFKNPYYLVMLTEFPCKEHSWHQPQVANSSWYIIEYQDKQGS